MKWFKRLLREKSANRCSPATTTISGAIANQCIYSDIREADANGSATYNEDNDDEFPSAILNGIENHTMIPKRIVTNLTIGGQRPKRRWTTSPYRSASRLMAKLEEEIPSENSRSPTVVCPKKPPHHQLIDPDDFFEDPDEVRTYCAEKKWLAEWCIVDDFVHIGFGSDEEDDDPDGLYATTAFCGLPEIETEDTNNVDANEETFVKVQRTPSVISLTSYTDDTFGIFYQSYQGCYTLPKVPEAYYHYTFEYDIQSGIAMDPVVSAFEEIMVETFNQNTSNLINKPKAVLPVSKDSRDIARMFCLSEHGSICLNVDHIFEERGFGFLMRRNKRLYRNVEWGQIACEQRRSVSLVDTVLDSILSCFRIERGELKGRFIVL